MAIHDVYGQRGNHQRVAPHAQNGRRSGLSGQAIAVEKVAVTERLYIGVAFNGLMTLSVNAAAQGDANRCSQTGS